MLGGLDPVLIFQFGKKVDPTFVGPVQPGFIARIPIVSNIPTVIDEPPIPIYLKEDLFNIVIDGESKNVDIDTTTETQTDGSPAVVTQKGVQSGITIEIEGKKDSVALILLSAMIDVAFDKVSSSEYSISYLHGPITVFRGLLNSFSSEIVPGTDKLSIKIGISRGKKNPTKPGAVLTVPGDPGLIPGG
jgi:hypothetical protein